ncbi:MAG: hypothetical protein FWE03_04760 [Firmicutes bacterium]|nr:hypothetical protein [Bacillota bacterium]
MKKLIVSVVFVFTLMVPMLFFSGCGQDESIEVPTLYFSTQSVMINDENLSQTVFVWGTATGDIILNSTTIYIGVAGEARVIAIIAINDDSIIITGSPLPYNIEYPFGYSITHGIFVTRQGITRHLTLYLELSSF